MMMNDDAVAGTGTGAVAGTTNATTTTNDDSDFPVIINLTLFSISNLVENDSDGVNLKRIVNESLGGNNDNNNSWCSCMNAETYMKTYMKTMKTVSGSTNDDSQQQQSQQQQQVQDEIQNSVTRYLQIKDKYSSLGSLLVKSHAFHKIHSGCCRDDNNGSSSSTSIQPPLSIVNLPRTKYKKPYIPPTIAMIGQQQNVVDNENKDDDITIANIYPLSVSHQYPFVGCAQQIIIDDDRHNTTNRNSLMQLGIDIVTFDSYNTRLYQNELEFISVFQDSFSNWEWRRIIKHRANMMLLLHEFYIRWCMKEAYTKALGVGMGIEFNSFTMKVKTDLDEDDINKDDESSGCDETGSLWSRILRQASSHASASSSVGGDGTNATTRPVLTIGTIIHENNDDKKEDEIWEFHFLPLYDDGDAASTTTTSYPPRGCVCVCVGPIQETPTSMNTTPKTTKKSSTQIQVEWTTLYSLLEWHRNTKKA